LRGKGAEIPWYTPFQPNPNAPPPEGQGTWELLLQRAQGRYLRLRLIISANGRASPRLAALRAWYPRFSYARHYLPATYQDDATSASFVERLLANPKGFYTYIEGAMRDIGALLDARSAPTDALDWLAGWVGVVFDPAWQQINQRRQTGSSPGDRRRLFIRFAVRLFTRRGTADGIRFALQLFLEPCLEALLARMRHARVEADPALAEILGQLGLATPDVGMTDVQVEDLLSQYLLSPKRPSKIRLVELFMSRDGRAAALGDPTGTTIDPTDVAHRFVVLVPESLAADELAMVSRIVELEKPAHTAFETRRYWEGFRVGEARLGIDTALGEDARFVPVLLGQTALAAGYLDYAPPPMGAADRLVLNRDRLGALPGL
jgi:phage tail-like protein